MEKKIGKNVSSGAETVETVEKKKKHSAENVDTMPAKSPKKNPVKKASAGKKQGEKNVVAAADKKSKPAQKKEKAAAQKRLEKAKRKAEKKEAKLKKKASLKEKKLEKRAALKEKKLARRAKLAEKRAERKKARIERKAALKEKKVERRAERIARREMLKNESKAEKQKRLARAKRERLALKRQKQEARNKAREEKIKARRAAHARKASDKKHKREQHTQRKQNRRGFGGWLAAVISLGTACLALAAIVTAGAFRLNDMTLASENSARATLYEMVSVTEDMDNSLSKLRVSSGVDEQRKLLTEILVNSALMENVLERIPVDEVTSTDISGFINRTNAYARTMLARLASGKTLTAEQKQDILALYEVNSKLSNELTDLANHMSESDLRKFLAGKEGTMSESFAKMGQNTRQEEIADAPFSEEGNVGQNKLSTLEEISSAQAEAKAKEYFSGYHVRKVRYTGETTALDITCYNFVLTDENDVEIYASITKNGGKLAFFNTYEECKQKNFDLETCDQLARDFLADLGIDNVEAVWLSDGGMVANLTYVSNEGGVRAYPDMIRVRVCESKGRVVGIDMSGYLLNHEKRSLKAGISKSAAQELLSSELEVTASNLALIPVDDRKILCYEFACNYGDEQYLIYLDADTGAEVQLFRVRQSAQGSYLE